MCYVINPQALIHLVLLQQVDANPLTAAATSGNEEMVRWLADDCGVTHAYTRVSISRKVEVGLVHTVDHFQARLMDGSLWIIIQKVRP